MDNKNIYSNRYTESKRKYSIRYDIWDTSKICHFEDRLDKIDNFYLKNCQPIREPKTIIA